MHRLPEAGRASNPLPFWVYTEPAGRNAAFGSQARTRRGEAMNEEGDRATVDDLRALLSCRSSGPRPEPAALPISREALAALVPHLTPSERRRMERLLPRTREEAVEGWLHDVI